MSTPLTCPISLAEFDASVTHIDKAVTLPPAAYTDTDLYEFERATVFDRSWLWKDCLSKSRPSQTSPTSPLLHNLKV